MTNRRRARQVSPARKEILEIHPNPDALVAAVDKYIEERGEGDPPTLAGMLKHLGFRSTHTFAKLRDSNEGWREACGYATLRLQGWIERELMTRKSGQTALIFLAKGVAPDVYSDKSQIETVNRNLNIDADKVLDKPDQAALLSQIQARLQQTQLEQGCADEPGTIIDGQAKRLVESNVSEKEMLKHKLKAGTTKEPPFAAEGGTQGGDEWML